MADQIVTAGFYPLCEGDIETSSENIFNSMNNSDYSLQKSLLNKKAGIVNTVNSEEPVKTELNKSIPLGVNQLKILSKRTTSLNAGKGAINYIQLLN